MENLTAFIDKDGEDWVQVEFSAAALNYQVHLIRSLEDLGGLVEKTGSRVVIIDLDRVRIDNRFFRSLKRRYPDLVILVASSHPYHPELGEAMMKDISACFRKPLEPEEIEFWLNAVRSDGRA